MFWRRESGVEAPPHPGEDKDALGVEEHYLEHWMSQFTDSRRVDKRRARWAVILIAALTGAISILGAVIALAKFPWLGILSTVLAAFIAVIAAWDTHFSHREGWIHRSEVLSQLQELSRDVDYWKALRRSRDAIAEECRERLNRILSDDVRVWADHRRSST